MINSVNFSGMEKPMNTNEKKASKQENKMETTTEQEAYIVDIRRTSEKKATYDNPGVVKPDIKKIEQLKKAADDALRPLRQMVEELLKKQGMYFKNTNLKPNEGGMVEIDGETRAEAQRLISDDGEYGIENTANRLFEFAKAVSGNDKTKINELKSAIEQGYKAAEKAFGGELPEICKKTLECTMEKLNQWAASEEE
jgi:anti-sigma28 factor (negative regulator of flagellin synthesis)